MTLNLALPNRFAALSLAALLSAWAPAHPAAADQLLEEYNAYIGREDLFNSNGERLTEAWQVVRQDRANFHRYNIRQSGDEGDSFFASMENRARAERMIQNGSIDPAAARRILQGDVMVRVRIYGRGSTGHTLQVTVY